MSEIVETRNMVDSLREVMKELSKEEAELIQALYFGDFSEKTYGEKLEFHKWQFIKERKMCWKN